MGWFLMVWLLLGVLAFYCWKILQRIALTRHRRPPVQAVAIALAALKQHGIQGPYHLSVPASVTEAQAAEIMAAFSQDLLSVERKEPE